MALAMRILLLSRMGDDCIKAWSYSCSCSAETMASLSHEERLIYTFGISEFTANSLCVSSVSYWSPELAELISSEVKACGFEYIEDLSLYLSQFRSTKVFINHELRSTLILTDTPTRAISRHFSSMISRLLPWYFPDGVDEDVMKVVRALMDETEATALIALANEIAEPYNFRNSWVRNTLSNIESDLLESQISNICVQIQSFRSSINSYLVRINEVLENKKEAEERLNSLRVRKSHGSASGTLAELINFIDKAVDVHITDISDTTLFFNITSYLDNFDPDLYSRMRDNDSYLNEYDSDVLDLLDAVYLYGTLKLRTYAYFYMDLKAGACAESGFYNSELSQTHLPNPHLYHHACLGGHESMLSSAMADSDYVYAMQIAMSATSNISFSDSTVGSELCEDLDNLFDSDCRCFEFPDGSLHTAEEALEYVRG